MTNHQITCVTTSCTTLEDLLYETYYVNLTALNPERIVVRMQQANSKGYDLLSSLCKIDIMETMWWTYSFIT